MTPSVTQAVEADRVQAAELYQRFPILDSSPDAALKTAQRILDGHCDDWTTVQLFAQHRANAIAEETERCARIADGKIEPLAERYKDPTGRQTTQARNSVATSIATAIRATVGERDDG